MAPHDHCNGGHAGFFRFVAYLFSNLAPRKGGKCIVTEKPGDRIGRSRFGGHSHFALFQLVRLYEIVARITWEVIAKQQLLRNRAEISGVVFSTWTLWAGSPSCVDSDNYFFAAPWLRPATRTTDDRRSTIDTDTPFGARPTTNGRRGMIDTRHRRHSLFLPERQ